MKKQLKSNTLKEKVFTNFFDTIKYRAIIYNSVGTHIDTVLIKRFDKTFKYKDGTYNVNFDHNSNFTLKTFWNRYKYFSYQLNDPDPINYNNVDNPKLPADLYNVMMETKVAKDLNNINTNSLLKYLTPTNLVILGVVLVAIFYFSSGGTIN